MKPRSKPLEELIQLSFFTDIGKEIVRETSIQGILKKIMEHVGLYFTPTNWSVLLHDEGKKELVFKLAVGKASSSLLEKRIPDDEGIAGWVLQNGVSVIVSDTSSDNRFSARIDSITDFKTDSIIAVPLRSGDDTIGVIELINEPNTRHFTPFDMNVLATIADFAGIAIEKAYYLQTLKKLTIMDHLTGLLNRRGLDKILLREERRMERYGGSISLIIADIDSFKDINDRHGHNVGDQVLKETARIIQASIREIDSAARFGGDEFVVVMPNTGAQDAEHVKTRIEEAFKTQASRFNPPFSVSIGLHSSDTADIQSIFKSSDHALYREKELRNPLTVREHMLDAFSEPEAED